MVKIIAFGLLQNGKHSYLRSRWNMLDFCILVTSLIDLSLTMAEPRLPAIKVFRVLRILRPIRIIARNQRLQVALTALLKSMPKILKLQALNMFLIFIIAIVQTNLLSGTFYRCYTDHLSLSSLQVKKLIKTKWQCLDYGGEWIAPDLNFDTLGQSFITLSSIATTEGWIQVLWNSVDAVGVDQTPEPNYRVYGRALYTLAILFVISLLFLNLFIGVVIDTFNRQKELNSYN